MFYRQIYNNNKKLQSMLYTDIKVNNSAVSILRLLRLNNIAFITNNKNAVKYLIIYELLLSDTCVAQID